MFTGCPRRPASVVHSVLRRRGKPSLLSSTRTSFRSKHDHIAFHITATPVTSSFVSYAMPPSIHTSGPCSHAISVIHDPMNLHCRMENGHRKFRQCMYCAILRIRARYNHLWSGEVGKPDLSLFVGLDISLSSVVILRCQSVISHLRRIDPLIGTIIDNGTSIHRIQVQPSLSLATIQSNKLRKPTGRYRST